MNFVYSASIQSDCHDDRAHHGAEFRRIPDSVVLPLKPEPGPTTVSRAGKHKQTKRDGQNQPTPRRIDLQRMACRYFDGS
jgi:hypothetical protein